MKIDKFTVVKIALFQMIIGICVASGIAGFGHFSHNLELAKLAVFIAFANVLCYICMIGISLLFET